MGTISIIGHDLPFCDDDIQLASDGGNGWRQFDTFDIQAAVKLMEETLGDAVEFIPTGDHDERMPGIVNAYAAMNGEDNLGLFRSFKQDDPLFWVTGFRIQRTADGEMMRLPSSLYDENGKTWTLDGLKRVLAEKQAEQMAAA